MTIRLNTILPAILNQIRPGATFLAVRHYLNNFGELSDFGLVFHANYRTAVKRAVTYWTGLPKPDSMIERQVLEDLILSYQATLAGHSRSPQDYEPILDNAGNLIKGVKWYAQGRECHLWGFRVHKRVLAPGHYPIDSEGPWAAVRRRFLAPTRLADFRQFKLVEGRFGHIAVAGLTLDQQDLLRQLS